MLCALTAMEIFLLLWAENVCNLVLHPRTIVNTEVCIPGCHRDNGGSGELSIQVYILPDSGSFVWSWNNLLGKFTNTSI